MMDDGINRYLNFRNGKDKIIANNSQFKINMSILTYDFCGRHDFPFLSDSFFTGEFWYKCCTHLHVYNKFSHK